MDNKNVFIIILLVIVFGLLGYMLMLQSEADIATTDYSAENNYSANTTRAPGGGQAVDHMEVLNDLKNRLKETPNDPALIAALGDSYFGLMQFEDAIVYYKQALAIKPDDVDTLNDMGLAQHYLGRSAEGLEYIEQGIEKNPYYQRVWLTKGFILAYGLGNNAQAIEAWEKAKSIDPSSNVGGTASTYIVEFTKQKEQLAKDAGLDSNTKKTSGDDALSQAEKSFYGK